MKFWRTYGTATALLTLGLVFLAIGVWRGEVETVFRKAAQICMECIGLG